MILTFILEQFASAANNSQNRVFCAGSTMDVNDVVKAKMWLFFPILDTKKKKEEKNNRLRKMHTNTKTSLNLRLPIWLRPKLGNIFFFFCSILSEVTSLKIAGFG